MEGSGVLKRRKPHARATGLTTVAAGKLHGGSGAGGGAGRGLRHFAVRVCQVVRSRSTTTYQKVADELVAEAATDDKNVRRRVYDSLNVLLALGVVTRDGKAVRWRGLAGADAGAGAGAGAETSGGDEQAAVRAENKELRRVIADKRRFLARTEEQCQHLGALVRRNADAAQMHAPPANECLRFPFLVLSCAPETNVELEVDATERDVTFTLDADFTILDDREVLRRLRFRARPAAASSHNMPLGVRLMAPATPSPARPTRSAILPPLPATPPSLISTPRRNLFPLPLPLPPQSPDSVTPTASGKSDS